MGVRENARPRNNHQSHTHLASNHCASQPCVRSTPTYVKIDYNSSATDCFIFIFIFFCTLTTTGKGHNKGKLR